MDQHTNNTNPFLLNSGFLQNHPMNMKMIIPPGFMEDHGTNMILYTNCFSHFHPPNPNDDPSVIRQQSSESSTVEDKLESDERLITPIDKKRKTRNGSSPNSAQSKDAGEAKVKKPKAEKKKADQEPPSGYIHVRARRGQATDSHSLAERVRREKISERMKVLQNLVPGCDRVTGKALMLDEIIDYVQSLQDQVEFLSMKLASANPMFYDIAMDQDSFIFMPSEASPVSQCSPNQATVFTDTPNDSSTLMGTSASILLHGQNHSPSIFSQDNATLLWDVEEQEQKFLNPSGLVEDESSNEAEDKKRY